MAYMHSINSHFWTEQYASTNVYICTCSEVYVIFFEWKANGADNIIAYEHKVAQKPNELLFIFPTNQQ